MELYLATVINLELLLSRTVSIAMSVMQNSGIPVMFQVLRLYVYRWRESVYEEKLR